MDQWEIIQKYLFGLTREVLLVWPPSKWTPPLMIGIRHNTYLMHLRAFGLVADVSFNSVNKP